MKSQLSFLRSVSHRAHLEIYTPEDVDGWILGLNERLGILLAPAGAIFLVGFGDRFLSAD